VGEQSLVVQKLEREQKLDRGVCSRPNFRAARMGEKSCSFVGKRLLRRLGEILVFSSTVFGVVFKYFEKNQITAAKEFVWQTTTSINN